MTSLEVQKSTAQKDILAQAASAKSAVRSAAASSLTKTPKSIEVGSTPIGVNTSTRQKRETAEWTSKELSKINRQQNIALKGLNINYDKAKASLFPRLDTSGLTTEEVGLINQGYGVEEINRRRQLASEETAVREMLAEKERNTQGLVLVAGNQYIPKEDYESLSDKDKSLVDKIGIEAYNKVVDTRNRKAQEAYETEVRAKGTFEIENFEIAPDVWLPSSDKGLWNSLTVSQKKEVIETGSYTPILPVEPVAEVVEPVIAEIPTTITPPDTYYEVETSQGTKQVLSSEWDKKDTFDKLTYVLGREPSAAEMESVARPDMPLENGVSTLQKIPVIGGFLGGLWQNFSLGLDLILPGTQSETEQYWRSTRGATADLLREYYQRQTEGWPFAVSPSEVGAISLLERTFFPAARAIFPGVSLGDITGSEWKNTALSVVSFALPKIVPPAVRAVKGIDILPVSFRSRLATAPFSERPGLSVMEPPTIEPVIWMPETAPVFREFVTPESPFVRTNFGPNIEPSLTSYPGVGELSYVPDYFKPSFYIKNEPIVKTKVGPNVEGYPVNKLITPSYTRIMPTKSPIYIPDIPTLVPNFSNGVVSLSQRSIGLKSGISPISIPKIGLGQVIAVPRTMGMPEVTPYTYTGLKSTSQYLSAIQPYTASMVNTKLGLGLGLDLLTTPYIRTEATPLEDVLTQTQVKIGTKVKTKTATKTALETLSDVVTGQGTEGKGNRRPFYLPESEPEDEEEEKKKKKKKKKKPESILMPVPGVYQGLVLHMPTPLEAVEKPFSPRPIVKKTKHTIRRSGSYPVAGFARVKL